MRVCMPVLWELLIDYKTYMYTVKCFTDIQSRSVLVGTQPTHSAMMVALSGLNEGATVPTGVLCNGGAVEEQMCH